MPLRDRTNTPNYATVPVPSNYAWQEKENSQQCSRDEKAAIAKALFDKEVERRVQEEKERHRLIDSKVQRIEWDDLSLEVNKGITFGAW